MGRDEYVKQVDEECNNENIPLDNGNLVNQQQQQQQQFPPGFIISNMGAPYGMVYTQVPINQQQQSQPPQHFNEGSNNFSAYLLKDGTYVPVVNNNINPEIQPVMPPIVINPMTTYEDVEHTVPALCLFLFGFIFFIPWIVNIIYIRSKNRIARGLAIISVSIFSFLVFILLLFILISVIVSETDNDGSSSSLSHSSSSPSYDYFY